MKNKGDFIMNDELINELIKPFELYYCDSFENYSIVISADDFIHRNITGNDIQILAKLFLVSFNQYLLRDVSFDSEGDAFRIYGKRERLIEFIKPFKTIWDNSELFNKLIACYYSLDEIKDIVSNNN